MEKPSHWEALLLEMQNLFINSTVKRKKLTSFYWSAVKEYIKGKETKCTQIDYQYLTLSYTVAPTEAISWLDFG